jgi:hypothetical protein
MHYGTAYKQNQGRCSGHWKGKPRGTAYTGPGCWACANGCGILCYLAIKGLEPNQSNITSNLNAQAECTWRGMTHSQTARKFPCIAQVTGRHGGMHFVIVDDAGSVFDPDAGERKTRISEYKVAGYLV